MAIWDKVEALVYKSIGVDILYIFLKKMKKFLKKIKRFPAKDEEIFGNGAHKTSKGNYYV